MCKKVLECPKKLEEVRQGKRDAVSSRCGFDGVIEIVCCPLDLKQKFGLRPVELACQQYQNEILPIKGLSFHILKGTEARSGEFPYAAALGYAKNDPGSYQIDYNCGGTLISSTFVLTAAHCVNNIDGKVPVRVRVGSDNLEAIDSSVQELRIEYILPSPSYKRTAAYNDIALIKLASPVKWSPTVKPICLPSKPIEQLNITSDSSLIVVGWGATNIDGDFSKILLKTPSLNVVSRQECSRFYAGFQSLRNGITDDVICVMDKNLTRGADACQGDSGGPLILINDDEESLVGIVSSGQICGSPVPALYTSVYKHLEWIESFVWSDRNSI
ncbi:serine protease persephone-like isoform X2 [Aphidius gifuensis]|nr:serine protease persephone-like isoform X2 [Aphidius gifuensis]XP_044001286.1 serine protease persephone-like isoform X2 [Aphidius gifuensis]